MDGKRIELVIDFSNDENGILNVGITSFTQKKVRFQHEVGRLPDFSASHLRTLYKKKTGITPMKLTIDLLVKEEGTSIAYLRTPKKVYFIGVWDASVTATLSQIARS